MTDHLPSAMFALGLRQLGIGAISTHATSEPDYHIAFAASCLAHDIGLGAVRNVASAHELLFGHTTVAPGAPVYFTRSGRHRFVVVGSIDDGLDASDLDDARILTEHILTFLPDDHCITETP